jgi:hypothetical protein
MAQANQRISKLNTIPLRPTKKHWWKVAAGSVTATYMFHQKFVATVDSNEFPLFACLRPEKCILITGSCEKKIS